MIVRLTKRAVNIDHVRSMFARRLPCTILLFTYLLPHGAHAWGKRGHAAVAAAAAYLLAEKPESAFIKAHAFDLGYYGNVPDFVWKAPATFAQENPQHYMNMEIFERGMKDSSIAQPFALDRDAFNKAFPKVPVSAGRSWWRIRELSEQLQKLAGELKNPNLKIKQRHHLQARWLMLAGVLGHYIGDLAQPLHCSENKDGEMTEQKGVHAFFETDVVNDYPPGQIEAEVFTLAKQRFSEFAKAHAKQDIVALLQELTADSLRQLPALLQIDKQAGRASLEKARTAYHDLLRERLAIGALFSAEIWRRATGWPYNGERFYDFLSTPAYIAPGRP